VAVIPLGGALALAEVCGTLMAAGQIGPRPDAVIETEVGFVLQLMGDSGTDRRVADLFGQGREIAMQDAVEIFAAEDIVDPVYNRFERGDVRQLQMPIG
jgi:hypothetical protein